MHSSYIVAAVIVLLIVVVVTVDILFFRDLFWYRLMANVGIVLIFGAFLLRFLNR